MRKKTVIVLYSLALAGFGLLGMGLGHALEGALAGSSVGMGEAASFAFPIKVFGAAQSIVGVIGVGWAYRLPKNPILSGYAGLNGGGLLIFLVGFFLGGPLWLLVAWALWLSPPPAARASSTRRR